MKYSILLLLAALMLGSCMTERKRSDIFHRYAREHRSEVLKYCPPVKEQVKPGKPDTVLVRDTVKVKVPYAVPGTTDTIWVECPETETIYQYIDRTDTLYRENTAELERLTLEREDYLKQIAAEAALREAAEQRAKNRLYWVIGLAIALAASAYIIFKS